jgi:hypothetical protein
MSFAIVWMSMISLGCISIRLYARTSANRAKRRPSIISAWSIRSSESQSVENHSRKNWIRPPQKRTAGALILVVVLGTVSPPKNAQGRLPYLSTTVFAESIQFSDGNHFPTDPDDVIGLERTDHRYHGITGHSHQTRKIELAEPQGLGQGFEVDAGLFVLGVLVWMGGEQRPVAFVGADDRVCASLAASELADGPGARLVQVVDHRDREVQQDIEHGAMLLGELWPRCRDRGRGHDQNDGLFDCGPDCRGGVDGGAAGECDKREVSRTRPPITRRRTERTVPKRAGRLPAPPAEGARPGREPARRARECG